MTVRELYEHLTARDIRLSRNGNRLDVDSPLGALSEELRAELIARREEMLNWVDVETTLSQHLRHMATSSALFAIYHDRGRALGHGVLPPCGCEEGRP